MYKIFVIAKNTFKEVIRDRILYVIFAFAGLFMISSMVIGTLSLGEDLKIIRDFGLAGLYLFSFVITVFLGASLIYKEIDKKTLYLIFSKPVSGSQYILGKFAGLLGGIGVVTVLMSIIYLGVVAISGGGFDILAMQAVLLQIFEMAIFVALSILFSTFTTPLASVLYGIIILYMGHSAGILLEYVKRGSLPEVLSVAARWLYYLVPNFEKFNVRNLVIHDVNMSLAGVFIAAIYAMAYVVLFLYLANAALGKREL